MKPEPRFKGLRRLIIDWFIKSWQAIPPEMDLEGDLISCFRKVRNAQVG